MANRRIHYRVRPALADLVQIELVGPQVHTNACTLLDLSAAGAGVELADVPHGLLASGDVVDLRVRSPRLDIPLRMQAEVAHVDAEQASPRLGLQFVDWRQHRSFFDGELKRLFNERRAYRVTPEVQRPVRVEVQWDHGRADGRLRDLSVTGAGIVLGSDTALDAAEVVTLHVHLPDPGAVVVAQAEVRHRRDRDHDAVLGLQLLANEREERRLERKINPWVMQRQRDLARLGLAFVA